MTDYNRINQVRGWIRRKVIEVYGREALPDIMEDLREGRHDIVDQEVVETYHEVYGIIKREIEAI